MSMYDDTIDRRVRKWVSGECHEDLTREQIIREFGEQCIKIISQHEEETNSEKLTCSLDISHDVLHKFLLEIFYRKTASHETY